MPLGHSHEFSTNEWMTIDLRRVLMFVEEFSLEEREDLCTCRLNHLFVHGILQWNMLIRLMKSIDFGMN